MSSYVRYALGSLGFICLEVFESALLSNNVRDLPKPDVDNICNSLRGYYKGRAK